MAGRGYSWKTFEPGNVAALRHGVHAADRAEVIEPAVVELAEQTAQQFPWTTPYADERRAYARAVLDEQTIRLYLDEVGFLDDEGNERPAVRTLDRFARVAARRRQQLGLTPMAHARLLALLSDVVRRHPADALDDPLQALLAEGRAALEAGARRAETRQEERS